MKIFGWLADEQGCGWYRIAEPLRVLADRGHDTHASMAMPDEWRDTADVVIGQRITQPGPTEMWRRLDSGYYGNRRPTLVYDIDDDLLDVDPANAPAYAYCRQPHVRENFVSNISRADLVTVTTPRLAEVVATYNVNVAVIPNHIPQFLLKLPPIPAAKDKVTVGWAGTDTHIGDFDEVAPELVRFLRRNRNVTYHSIGRRPAKTPAALADPYFGLFPSLRGIPVDQLRTTPFRLNVHEYYATLDFHVGIAPLRATRFNASKSDIKFVEMAARRIPTIASNVGPYAHTVIPEKTGILVGRPHEWSRALRALTSDQAMRNEIAANAYDYALGRTIEGNVSQWEDALCR